VHKGMSASNTKVKAQIYFYKGHDLTRISYLWIAVSRVVSPRNFYVECNHKTILHHNPEHHTQYFHHRVNFRSQIILHITWDIKTELLNCSSAGFL
jgi:hypothetical protein